MNIEQIKGMKPEYEGDTMQQLEQAMENSPRLTLKEGNNPWVQGAYLSFKPKGLRVYPAFFVGLHKDTNEFVLEILG